MRQEEDLLKNTSKRTWIAIVATAAFMTLGYGSKAQAAELTPKDLKSCITIIFMETKKGIIVPDSADEYTRNFTKEEAIEKAVDRANQEKATLKKDNGYCSFTVETK